MSAWPLYSNPFSSLVRIPYNSGLNSFPPGEYCKYTQIYTFIYKFLHKCGFLNFYISFQSQLIAFWAQRQHFSTLMRDWSGLKANFLWPLLRNVFKWVTFLRRSKNTLWEHCDIWPGGALSELVHFDILQLVPVALFEIFQEADLD